MRSLSWADSSSSSAPRLIALPSSSEISPRTSLWAWRISIGLPPFAAGLIEPRVAAGVDLDLERDARAPGNSRAPPGGARDARRAGIPVHLGIELADLAGAVGHLERGAAPDAPVAAADAVARLEHGAVVAGLAELIGRRQPGDAGAENDDLGAVAVALLQASAAPPTAAVLDEAHRLHGEVGRPVAADAADLTQEVPTRAAHLDPRNR